MKKVSFREASRRYMRVFITVMVFYGIVCFAGPFYLASLEAPPTWMYATMAVTNALPLLVVFWVMARFLKETDEYTRKNQAEALLTGGAITLSITFIWSFLELYQVVPRWEHLSVTMLVVPVFFACYGLAALYQSRKRGDSLSCGTD